MAVQVFWTCQFAGHFVLSQKTKIATFRHLHHDDGILVHCIGARLLDITGARNYSILQPKTASCENGPSMSKLISNLNISQHIFNYLHGLHIHILLILNIGIRQKLSWKVCFPSPVAKCRQVQRENFIQTFPVSNCLQYFHCFPPVLAMRNCLRRIRRLRLRSFRVRQPSPRWPATSTVQRNQKHK